MIEEQQTATIPLVEERLSVGTRKVETGRVRVSVEVDQREETVAKELARDEVDIEHVPMDVPLDALPDIRVEGDTTIIPIVEERLVVEKRLVLVEEIHLHRRQVSEIQEVPVTLRAERAVIERDGEDESSPDRRTAFSGFEGSGGKD